MALDQRLNSELASLIEEGNDLPPVNFHSIKKEILGQMKLLGRPKYEQVIYENFDLNDSGELILGDQIIDDGEDIEWV